MLKPKVLFVVLMVFCAPFLVSNGFAQETAPESPKPAKAVKASAEPEELMDMGMNRNSSKLDELERRIVALEREQRSVDSRLRMVDRAVDDVRRQIR